MAYAGLFNEVVEIYDFTKTKSQEGVVKDTMNLSYTTRAKVGHISGSRSVINDEIQTPYSKNFVLRYYVPINDTSWLKYGGSYYMVTCIDKNKELQQQVITADLVQE